MRLLQKLPDSQRSPPGLERRILRKIPSAILASIFIPLAWYWLSSVFPSPAAGESVEKYLSTVGIAAIATAVTAWTAILTVAIGCIIVVLMKGPGYVADQYPLSDADEPRQIPEKDHQDS